MNRCSECWLPSEGELCRDCMSGADTPVTRRAHEQAHISKEFALRERARDSDPPDVHVTAEPLSRKERNAARMRAARAAGERTDADRAADRDRQRRHRA